MNEPTASSGRVLAIDFGTVRLGLAISDFERRFASPYENYTRINTAADACYLQRVIQEERVVQLVVGLPVHLDGRESQKSREVRGFVEWLSQLTTLPVALVDERFSSFEAEQYLLEVDMPRAQRKKRLDKIAAQILLKVYLESPERAEQPPRGLE